MSVATSPHAHPLPLKGVNVGFKRFTVAEYDNLVRLGALTEHDNLELIEGYLVHKMPHNPPHDGAVFAAQDLLTRLLPAGWVCRVQSVLALPDSRPEPDVVIARGDRRTYFTRHPAPADLGFVIEVADTTVAEDRSDSQRIYARAGVGEYWIVNIPARQVEVYTDPQPTADPPRYATRTDYPAGASVPVTLLGAEVGAVATDDVLP